MADQKLTALTTLSALTTDDIMYVVNDPGGLAESRKVAISVFDARYQAIDAELTALAGLTSVADRVAYFTGSGTAALATLTSFARTLIDDVDAAAMRTTLGLVIGTNVQALDAFLTSIAALGTAADRLIYTTGVDTAAEAVLTSFARTLLDDTTQAAMRTTLGLTPGTDVQAFDAELAAIAGLTSAADRVPYFTGSGAASLATFTAFGRSIVDDADSTAGRVTLGVVIGTNVQAWDADLDALAALAATAGMLSRTGAGAFAVRTLTAGANIGITNGSGAAGNPTVAATPSGSDTQVQFNDASAFGGDADFIWNKTSNFAAIAGAAAAAISRTGPGLELRMGNSASLDYAPMIKWMSTDNNLTTQNPKLLSFITGWAVQAYDGDVDGGMALVFGTTPIDPGASSVPVERMHIMHDGTVNIFNEGTVPIKPAQLAVSQGSATVALPVLSLRQLDISEEFINFRGQSTNGVLTQSIVEDADITTATRAGWLKVFVTDDGNQLTDQAYFLPIYTLA